MSTQKEQVLAHLKKHKKITSWEAIQKYNITRLAAHIFELGTNHRILSVRTTDKVSGKWYATYRYLGEKK